MDSFLRSTFLSRAQAFAILVSEGLLLRNVGGLGGRKGLVAKAGARFRRFLAVVILGLATRLKVTVLSFRFTFCTLHPTSIHAWA